MTAEQAPRNDVENSMGNTELRLTLASIESEVVEIKGIAIETREQAKKTNGRVSKHDWQITFALGALCILTPVVTWFAYDYLQSKRELSPIQQAAIQAAVYDGLTKAAETYNKK